MSMPPCSARLLIAPDRVTEAVVLAATQAGTAQGALLLEVYSAGLAIPFLISAIAFNRLSARSGSSGATT